MYCPKCGDQMVEDGEIFTCVKGRSPTSIDLARRLREYEAGKQLISQKKVHRGGAWIFRSKNWVFTVPDVAEVLISGLFIFSSSSIPLG